MSKMRHFADEELLGLGQKPPGTLEETPAFSDMSPTPVANGMNQSSVVCFPLISESRKLVWVHSHQIDSQIHGAAELDEAFDRFPYLTHRQTAKLAESCHLHPDQVKAWFMAQRLRYGISWDYEDIREVQRKFNSSQEKKELQEGKEREVIEDGREKRKVKATDGNAKGRGVRGDSANVNKQLKKEQPVKETKSSTQKRKWATATEKMGKKIVKRDKEERMDKVESGGEKCPKRRGRKRKKPRVNKSCLQEESNAPPAPSSLLGPQAENQTSSSPAPDNQTRLLQRAGDPSSTIDGDFREKNEIEGADLQAEPDHRVFITDIDELKALIEVKNTPSSAEPTPTTRLHCKTPAQLVMMKMAFLQCQYPDKEQYSRLARMVGLPRLSVIQWFGDMRYFIKRGRPRWMNEEQHHQVLGNVMYQQYMNAMTKIKLPNSMNSWIMMLEGNKGYSEEKNVKIPPE